MRGRQVRAMETGLTGLWKRVKMYKEAYFMLAPFTLLFVTFTIVPILAALYFSFTSFNMLQKPEWVGAANYTRLFFTDDVFLIAVKNTLLFAFITGPIGYLLSFMFAWFINDLGPKLRSVLTLIFYAPSLAGNVFFIWLYLFSGDAYGFANSKLMSYGIIKEPILWLTDPKYNFTIVVLVIIWLSMGAGFLAFIAGLQTVDTSLNEAGVIDGIQNRWQELWYITIPQMVPQLLFGAVMTIATSFAVGYQSMALTGFPSTDYSTHTIVLHLLDYGAIRFEMGYASAIAVVLFAGMLFVWNVLQKSLRKISD
ncbi:multiple sugar transport system permease protein [Paenibacillus taihuensis]|uniref:Multiple sugar transport system permease protein n=2 Tax=Paenibacillus taihuensis TaxID=1156355 RepID=A0A3D9Q1I0_9BACL|nr:multiple sugar transport system permease protein [Paenibacillus taihuensis]